MPFATIDGRAGMHASLRTYRIGSGSVVAVMRRVDRDFAEALSQEPGFVAYHAIDTGNDMVVEQADCHDPGTGGSLPTSWRRSDRGGAGGLQRDARRRDRRRGDGFASLP